MIRYLRLYLYFLQFSFSKALEFRVEFYFRIIMDISIYIVNLAFFKILFLQSTEIGGLSESQGTIFCLSYLIMNSLILTVLGNNLWYFPIYINKGDLDYYLLRPVSPKFFLALREISLNSFINVLLGLSVIFYYFNKFDFDIPVQNYIYYILFSINGLYLYYLIRMIFILPVFWIQGGRGLDELFWNIQMGMQRPHQIFSGVFKIIFTNIIPLALISSYPVKFLFNGVNQSDLITVILTTVILTIVFNLFWKLALRNYSSASS